jgi:ATP-binding cassette, subfamily A (ABC1), member 1
MVTRLAEERESRAREGMRMMGMPDFYYFSGWFIFLACINLVIGLCIVTTLSFEVLKFSSPILVLAMCLLYGSSLFGISFAIVSVFPSIKASATAASILHLCSFYVALCYKGYVAGYAKKVLVACLVPNAALSFMLDHLLHCEIEGGTGLTFTTASMSYQNFDFFTGLICLTVSDIIWGLFGMYIDQVAPREIGLPRPWDFPCRRQYINRSPIQEQESHRDDLE